MRPGDRTLKGMPHSTDGNGVMRHTDSRIAHLGPQFLYGGEKLNVMLASEMEMALEAPTPAGPTKYAGDQVATRIVELMQEYPDAAKADITGAMADMKMPGLAALILEAVERRAPASGPSGPR